MKTYPHPDFPSLTIIEAQTAADKPQPGAFFVTHQTVDLSQIANRAYGTPVPPSTMLTITKRINRSKYNMQKCLYRFRSDDCYSSRVDSAGALTTSNWGPGAWLSLCNADKAGTDNLGLYLLTKYQVIWIPTADGKEPWDLAEPTTDTMPTLPTVPKVPDMHIVIPPTMPKLPGVDIDIGVKVEGPSDGQPVADDTGTPEVKKSGVGWVLAAVLGAGALVTVIYFAGRDKGKKGKR